MFKPRGKSYPRLIKTRKESLREFYDRTGNTNETCRRILVRAGLLGKDSSPIDSEKYWEENLDGECRNCSQYSRCVISF